MNVGAMCVLAAQLSDRSDEYVKNDEGAYEEEAALYRAVFLSAMNEAYREAAKKLGMPLRKVTVTPVSYRVSFKNFDPPYVQIIRIEDAVSRKPEVFKFVNAQEIEVFTERSLTITYIYLPDELVLDTDEPEFADSLVDPMLYVYKAVAEVYRSERKNDTAAPWDGKYFEKLSKVRAYPAGALRRVPRRRFR